MASVTAVQSLRDESAAKRRALSSKARIRATKPSDRRSSWRTDRRWSFNKPKGSGKRGFEPANRLSNSMLRHASRETTTEHIRFTGSLRQAKRHAKLGAAIMHAQRETTQRNFVRPPAMRDHRTVWDGKEYRDKDGIVVGVWRFTGGQFEVLML